jgi:hypothetical protein
MTTFGVRQMCNSTLLLCDGTFYTCPGLFSQLYTVHGIVDGVVYPFVFALLPNKTELTYNRLFTLLKDSALRMNLVLTPETVLMDFEAAAQNAVETAFPLTTLKGCFFHYGQCIWRKVQECGLVVRFKNDDTVKRLVKRAAVLPHVPVHLVEDVWLFALEQNDELSPAIVKFKDYVTETWVEGHRGRRMWNHYDTEGPRTTNNVEGWHSKLKKLCQHAHPNVFVMVKLLQGIQATNEAKQIQLSAGGLQRPREVKYRDLETRLGQLKASYTTGRLNVTAYADAASHLVRLEPIVHQ